MGVRPVPDPRAAGRGAIDPVLAEIVAAEGPILALPRLRALQQGLGRQEATSIARAPMSASAYRLGGTQAHPGRRTTSQGEDVLRWPTARGARARARAAHLDEVPLDEVAELERLAPRADDGPLKRAVLTPTGSSADAKADEYLERALDLAGSA